MTSHRRGRGSAAILAARHNSREVRLTYEALEDRRLLVVTVSGNGNIDAASLESYLGPSASYPEFNNVGRSSTGNASVVYLGDGWALSANHVTIANPGGVTFGSNNYLIDTSTRYQLHSPNGSLADLQVFKIIGEPGLPSLMHRLRQTTVAVDDQVFMIGNGLSITNQRYWNLDIGQTPWVWTDTTPYNASTYDIEQVRYIRWGENTVDATGIQYLNTELVATVFDDEDYSIYEPLSTPLPHEAQATVGDSGGPAFSLVGGEWVLSGIMLYVNEDYSGQPSNTITFSSATYMADLSYYRDEILGVAGVLGRNVFYNQSKFDGNDPAINAADDAAIATEKVAYLPGGGLIGPESMTSYSRGINGIMVDLISNHGTLTSSDFTFKVGSNNTPSTWVTAPDPTGFVVRAGAGVDDSDRIEITWADGAIANTYLQVIVEGDDSTGGDNTNTGLVKSDIFYFGNKIGDDFDPTTGTVFNTNSTDQVDARDHFTIFGVTKDNIYDFDRNGLINSTDQVISRDNFSFLTRINIGSPPAAPEAVPAGAIDDDGGSAVAFALAGITVAGDPERQTTSWTSLASPVVGDERALREYIFERFASERGHEFPPAEDDDLDGARDELWLVEDAGILQALTTWRTRLPARGALTLP